MTALVLDIITTAAILFAVASGLLIILGVLKIVNFAHGGFLTIGGYSGLVVTQLGWNAWMAYPSAAVAGVLMGAVTERFVIRPLYDRPLDAILATWGLGIIIGQLITIAFGREIQFVQTPITGATSVIGGTYSLYRLFLVVAAAALAATPCCSVWRSTPTSSRPASTCTAWLTCSPSPRRPTASRPTTWTRSLGRCRRRTRAIASGHR